MTDDRANAECSLDLLVAVLARARMDASRDPDAELFLADVARRCLAEAGGSAISAGDVAWATLAAIWERRSEGGATCRSI